MLIFCAPWGLFGFFCINFDLFKKHFIEIFFVVTEGLGDPLNFVSRVIQCLTCLTWPCWGNVCHILSERSCGHMAKGKDIRKDEESELVMQSNATVSFDHFVLY